MLINADFSQPAIVASHQQTWVPSPQSGVERIMLDRVGAEKGHATSIVRYATGSHFPQHGHPGGEEILVLSGTFSDETGDFPAGFYLRNPPATKHIPFSEDGCIIFVKLWQMSTAETDRVRVDTRNAANWQKSDEGEVCTLYRDEREAVCLLRLQGNTKLPWPQQDGAELLVLAGNLTLDGKQYPTDSWLRLPAGHAAAVHAGPDGVTVYRKTGHLRQAQR